MPLVELLMAKTEFANDRSEQERHPALRPLELLLATLLFATLLCGCHRHEPTVAPLVKSESGAPSAAEWVGSEDGVLALRLASAPKEVARGATIRVVAQLRNASQTPVTVLRPFGDWPHAWSVGLKVWSDQGQLRYAGPMPSYVVGGNAFTVLAPGEVVEDRLELMNDIFSGLARLGTYTLRYDYSYQGYWDATAAVGNSGISDIWRGTISSREVQVIRR